MIQVDLPALILASASRARASVLVAACLRFVAVSAAVDEASVKRAAQAEGADIAETAVLLADLKAARVARQHPDAVVLGADQMLVCEGTWFDKPMDRADTTAQLQALRGKTHELVSAVVAWRGGARVWQHVARPRMTMRRFSDAFLDAYLDHEGDAVLGSVGGYRIEGAGVHLFASVSGDHTSILGLPLLPLLEWLRATGLLLR